MFYIFIIKIRKVIFMSKDYKLHKIKNRDNFILENIILLLFPHGNILFNGLSYIVFISFITILGKFLLRNTTQFSIINFFNTI